MNNYYYVTVKQEKTNITSTEISIKDLSYKTKMLLAFRQRTDVSEFYCPDTRSSCRISTKR